jgi:hypothetical protein
MIRVNCNPDDLSPETNLGQLPAVHTASCIRAMLKRRANAIQAGVRSCVNAFRKSAADNSVAESPGKALTGIAGLEIAV